jgi:hypothetical protein
MNIVEWLIAGVLLFIVILAGIYVIVPALVTIGTCIAELFLANVGG